MPYKPTHKPKLAKELFLIVLGKNDVSYPNCQAYPDDLTMNNNIFDKIG
jgi:hypothetical protein